MHVAQCSCIPVLYPASMSGIIHMYILYPTDMSVIIHMYILYPTDMSVIIHNVHSGVDYGS